MVFHGFEEAPAFFAPINDNNDDASSTDSSTDFNNCGSAHYITEEREEKIGDYSRSSCQRVKEEIIVKKEENIIKKKEHNDDNVSLCSNIDSTCPKSELSLRNERNNSNNSNNETLSFYSSNKKYNNITESSKVKCEETNLKGYLEKKNILHDPAKLDFLLRKQRLEIEDAIKSNFQMVEKIDTILSSIKPEKSLLTMNSDDNKAMNKIERIPKKKKKILPKHGSNNAFPHGVVTLQYVHPKGCSSSKIDLQSGKKKKNDSRKKNQVCVTSSQKRRRSSPSKYTIPKKANESMIRKHNTLSLFHRNKESYHRNSTICNNTSFTTDTTTTMKKRRNKLDFLSSDPVSRRRKNAHVMNEKSEEEIICENANRRILKKAEKMIPQQQTRRDTKMKPIAEKIRGKFSNTNMLVQKKCDKKALRSKELSSKKVRIMSLNSIAIPRKQKVSSKNNFYSDDLSGKKGCNPLPSKSMNAYLSSIKRKNKK